MNRKKQVLMALAIAGLLVALTVAAGLKNPKEPTVSVVAVRSDIPAGTVLREDHLMSIDLPQRLLIASYLKDIKLAVGQATELDLHEGQLLDSRWLNTQPEGIAFPEAITDGRLYTLRLPAEHANGFWLAAGNRVDVHLIPKGQPSDDLPDILPGIRIASLIGTGNSEGSGTAVTVLPSTLSSGSALVCLNVNTAQARVLAMAEACCTIKLVPINEPESDASAGSYLEIDLASFRLSPQARFD